MPDSIEVTFPFQGTDTSGEYGVQRKGTTARAFNVRSTDPILERTRGGARHGLVKYPSQQIPEGAQPIQGMGQLVIQDADYLLATFEDYQPDFIADPSTNNTSIRNPGRFIPPAGSGVTPVRSRPDNPRRRVALVASTPIASDGTTVTLTATLTRQTGGATISGKLLTLFTDPPGSNGDGATATTNGSGVAVFSVSEATYEGDVRYLAANEYTPPA